MQPFYADVSSPHEAYKILSILSQYDLFQLHNNIKPDFSKTGGLNVYIDDEWIEWDDYETGIDIWEFGEILEAQR